MNTTQDKINMLKAAAGGYLMMVKALPKYADDGKKHYLKQARECIEMAQALMIEEEANKTQTFEYKNVA